MITGEQFCGLLLGLLCLAVVVGLAQQPAVAISYVHLDGQSFLETVVPDTVDVTADCAQAGNRLIAEIFLDLNENSVVDGNEAIVQFAYINDGIPSLKSPEEDKIPGDDDAQANGLLLHRMELGEEEYSFSTHPMQFIVRITDQDHSMAEAVIRVFPPVAGFPYIAGTVTEAGAAAPLDGMVVVASELNVNAQRATLTDEQGRYVLNVEAGDWVVYAGDLENYYAPSEGQTISVAAQDSAVEDFALAPYPGYITGRIDSSSNPVPGIMIVAIDEQEGRAVGWTQASGFYRIGVYPGTYHIHPIFLPPGYASQPQSFLGVAVDSGITVEGKDFLLRHLTSRIEGRVTYQTGGGASGVTVSAHSISGNFYSTATDEEGYYSMTVYPSLYMLSAELSGYDVVFPVNTVYLFVTVNFLQVLTGYDFVIAPSSGEPLSISGTVTYQGTGQPAENVYAVILNEDENSSRGWEFAATDSTGYFEFGDIISGTWLIGVYQPDYDSEPSLREQTLVPGSPPATGQDFQLVVSTAVPQGWGADLPGEFSLFPNRPNPFNDETLIAYSLSNRTPERVTLRIFNVLGQEVCTLVNGHQGAGLRLVRWDGRSAQGLPVASGVYFCELEAGGQRQVRKLVLMR